METSFSIKYRLENKLFLSKEQVTAIYFEIFDDSTKSMKSVEEEVIDQDRYSVTIRKVYRFEHCFYAFSFYIPYDENMEFYIKKTKAIEVKPIVRVVKEYVPV